MVKKDTEETKVCFIDFNGEITAIFPELQFTTDKKYLTCYAHVGQHGAAHPDLVSDYEHLNLDNPKIKSLYIELSYLGYNLKIISKYQGLTKSS